MDRSENRAGAAARWWAWRGWPVLVLVLAIPAAALAQPGELARRPSDRATDGREAPAPTPTPAPVIIVTGRGLDASPATPAYDTQVLDRAQLVSTASGRIEDALAAIAGFQQFRRSDSRSSNPSAQGATLRALGGNATSRALVLLDGVPQSDPFFGYVPFAAIAPERLASARVTRGGGSGPFGAGAVAGTIELFSAGPGELAPLSARALVNELGGSEIAAGTATRLGAGFATVSGRWDRGPGFFTTPTDQRVPATARARYDSRSAQIRAVAPVGEDIEFQARGLIYEDDRTLRFTGADNGTQAQDASVRLVGRGAWAFDLIGYVQARNFTNVVISSTRFVPVLDQRNTPSTGLGGKLEVRPPVGPRNTLRLGVDYRKAEGELYETALSAFTGAVTARRNAGGANTDLGLFVENDTRLGPAILTAGARVDRYTNRDGFFRERTGAGALAVDARYPDRAGWAGTFRGGAVVDAGGGVRLRAAAYTGLRLPTLNELYRPFVVFPVETRANAALRNERLEGYEAGIDLTPAPGLRLSLTAFDNRVKHAIANVTIGPDLRQRRNIDSIAARGIEAAAAVEWRTLSLDGTLAYTDAQARGSGPAAALDGRRPAQTPRFAGSATLAWRPAADWLLSTTLRRTGAQFEDDLESDVLPAYTTLDVFAQILLARPLSLILRAENLTDATIVTRNQGGSIDLGVPRTLWAGMKVEL